MGNNKKMVRTQYVTSWRPFTSPWPSVSHHSIHPDIMSLTFIQLLEPCFWVIWAPLSQRCWMFFMARWWQLKYFLEVSSRKLGKIKIPILRNIVFFNGGFGWNHQLDGCFVVFVSSWISAWHNFRSMRLNLVLFGCYWMTKLHLELLWSGTELHPWNYQFHFFW